MGNLTCLQCGGPAQTNVWKGWHCASCERNKLLKEQNRLRQEQLRAQQQAYSHQKQNTQHNYHYSENIQSNSPSTNNTSDDLVGTVLAFGIGIALLMGIYNVITWLLSWIWAIVSWPFKFSWLCFENVIVGTTRLAGVPHSPAWWETSILISIVFIGLICVWHSELLTRNGDSESDAENQKIGFTLLALVPFIACGIWISPTASITTFNSTAIIQTEDTSTAPKKEQQIEDLSPKIQVKPAP